MLSISILNTALKKPNLVNHARSTQVRTLKSDLKIKWVRPVKIPSIDPVKSGDLKPLQSINEKELPDYMQKSEELKSASDLVKRLFTLEFMGRKETMRVISRDMVRSVRRHKLDSNSMECSIARMTAVIRNFQEVYPKYPTNKFLKVRLKEVIERRYKYLSILRNNDYKRFEWLLEKLELQYRPFPYNSHHPTRKGSLQKLTDKYCEDLKKERLEAFKIELESQKEEFLSKKVDTLKWIIEEEKACGVTPSVTQDDIDKTIKQLEELKMKKEVISNQL